MSFMFFDLKIKINTESDDEFSKFRPDLNVFKIQIQSIFRGKQTTWGTPPSPDG